MASHLLFILDDVNNKSSVSSINIVLVLKKVILITCVKCFLKKY